MLHKAEKCLRHLSKTPKMWKNVKNMEEKVQILKTEEKKTAKDNALHPKHYKMQDFLHLILKKHDSKKIFIMRRKNVSYS